MKRSLFVLWLPVFLLSQEVSADALLGRSVGAFPEYQPGIVLIRLTAKAVNLPSFPITKGTSSASQTGLSSVDAVLNSYGLQEVREPTVTPRDSVLANQLGLDRDFLCMVSESADIVALSAELSALAEVEAASPDWYARIMKTPDDPLYSLQWGHDNQGQMKDCGCTCTGSGDLYCCNHETGTAVGTTGFDADVDNAWTKISSYGDPDVIIAILDTGTDVHPDLRLVAGWNVIDDNNITADVQGHGTATAGIAAAIADNEIGVAGVAGGCSVMPVRVGNADGSVPFSAQRDGIIWAADHEADIISMSFGGPAQDPTVEDAVEYAYGSCGGVVLFASAGNSNCEGLYYPAAYDKVIAVGAASPCNERKRSSSITDCLALPSYCPDTLSTSCDREHYWGSTYGDGIDFIAPTILPTTDQPGNKGYNKAAGEAGNYFKWFNGTSCSCPFAAGIAALILSTEPWLSPAEVRQRMIDGAVDVTSGHASVGYDKYTGHGMVNAFNSVGARIPIPTLSQGGLIAFGVLLLTATAWALRRRRTA